MVTAAATDKELSYEEAVRVINELMPKQDVQKYFLQQRRKHNHALHPARLGASLPPHVGANTIEGLQKATIAKAKELLRAK